MREAQLDDIPRLKALEQCVVDAERPYNAAIRSGKPTYYNLEYLIKDQASQLLVAEEGGKLVAKGYIQIRASKDALCHERHAYLGFMYVVPEYRGQGLNQRVVQALLDWARSRGIRDFYLDVYSQNTAAINAYKKMGFVSNMIEMKLNDDCND